MKRTIACLAFILVAGAASAQSPYAGMQTRPIKALSEQQVADLKAGRGMGLAMPAELNGYPGPSHVLELADKLALTPAQRDTFTAMFASMKAEAVPLGEQLIALEGTLDRQFADRTVTPGTLSATTAQIAELQGKLRNAHLKYHLTAADALTPDQRQIYATARGYSAGHQSHGRRY
jgi:Spy/CpxP family protein refolding chaperone